MKITQRQLEQILANEGVVPYDAVEDPQGFDHGKTELAIGCAADRINELLSEMMTTPNKTTDDSLMT